MIRLMDPQAPAACGELAQLWAACTEAAGREPDELLWQQAVRIWTIVGALVPLDALVNTILADER